MGSYLGLFELWNEFKHCTDDHVEDTPIHNAPNFMVPSFDERHISICPQGPIDEMFMNYMDNTDDVGSTLFTQGQKSRMKAVLSADGARSGLKYGASACGNQQLMAYGGLKKVVTTSTGNGENSLKVMPNPSKGKVTLVLKSDAALANVVIYNGFGAKMADMQSSLEGRRSLLKVEADGWPSGLYHVAVRFSDGVKLNTVFSIAR